MNKPLPFKDVFQKAYFSAAEKPGFCGQPHLGSGLLEYTLEFQKFETPESARAVSASGLTGLVSKLQGLMFQNLGQTQH